ncbi:tripartite motif-containing protein 16-like [Colossoma macropomum]|uniref:tripartite motif-containing protein 16-like n=1 Tax=Colossoma macropomum TaxID=42526 RepID=UPI0018653028|nr:tripartite motif-containing protein 16-like [Colossoma macropomum]
MTESSISVDQNQFSCSICLELLMDPVTTPCGHNFCKLCIKSCWDEEDLKGVYSCPQCRCSFTPRPVVGKNNMLAEVVEKLKTLHQATSTAHCPAGPEEVECDFCTGRKLKALKSCLVCRASYCETHIQSHYESSAFKNHKLVKVSRRLQEQICSEHEKQLEVYCRTDQQCICMLCTMDGHKGHDTVSGAAERAEKQNQLLETQRKFQQKIQEKEKELQELKKAVESHMSSAQAAVKNCEKIFTELICSIERKRSELSEMIRTQEKVAVTRAEEALKRLEQEIEELRRRDADLEQLSHTEDHIHFLQSFPSFSAPPEFARCSTTVFSPLLTFEEIVKTVFQLSEKLEEHCEQEFKKISSGVKEIMVVPLPEPQSREEFLEYSCELTMDPNTVNTLLHMSEGNMVVTCSETVQSYPPHPERFDFYPQVLCRESVGGRCYWEVDWSGSGGLYIAVSYKGISRKGNGFFGYNDQSWSLFCSPSSYSFVHNSKGTVIPIGSDCSRIGVYVDYSAGIVSFYSISETMILLHRVQTTFTQPLYPGFWVGLGSALKLSHPPQQMIMSP